MIIFSEEEYWELLNSDGYGLLMIPKTIDSNNPDDDEPLQEIIRFLTGEQENGYS